MMQIVKYEVLRGILTVGFKVDNFVVFSSIPFDESNSKGELLQEAYRRVKKTIEYERTQTEHSFVTDEEGEVFIPDAPHVEKIVVEGDTIIQFMDAKTESRTVEFTAKAYDQYGDAIAVNFEWDGADGGVLSVANDDDSFDVTVSASGVSESITVRVYAYQEPVYVKPLEEELEDVKAANETLAESLIDFKVAYMSVPCQSHQDYPVIIENLIEGASGNGD